MNYSILKHPVSGPPKTVFSTPVYNQELIQLKFDHLVKGLEVGEVLEYMKEDKVRFHPNMLVVERTETGFVRWTEKGDCTYDPTIKEE